MRSSTRGFVLAISVTAFFVVVGMYLYSPTVPDRAWGPLLLLGALAISAELLGFVLARSAIGSIAFIPYLALVFVVPNWTALVAVAVVRLLAEARSKEPIKAAFNVSQHVISTAGATAAFLAFGGESFLHLRDLSFVDATLRIAIPALAACWISLVLNSVLVSAVISISTGTSFRETWRENFRSTVALGVVSGPVIIVFAWVYSAYGPIAAATVWVPILGLRQVQKANFELERTNRELLELMVKSIEARDPYTSGHSRRVRHYSLIIARAIGLREREIQQIGQAALLHDIGKIYEKYAPILRKADKLTAEEWTTMQQHPIDGADLVATMSELREIVPAVRHHHENWDGTGYPSGLTGESIPLAARVITLADTIDAMMSERPYRAALSETQVRSEIVRCRAQQFDPAIVDRLLSSPMWRLLFAPTVAQGSDRAPFSVIRGQKRAGLG